MGVVIEIRDEESVQLANELARRTGRPVEEVVRQALQHEHEMVQERFRSRESLDELLNRIHARPIVDDRPVDELLGYNASGTFDE
jgi:antitoxin VapB